MQDLTHLFRKTIEDQKLSSAEKKALLLWLREKQLHEGSLHFLRKQIFEMAKEQLPDYSAQQILTWVEGANKVILKYSQEQRSTFKQKVYFSPGQACRQIILQRIRDAQKSLKICVFTISDDKIAEEIVFAHKRFLDVKVITDDDKTEDKGSDIAYLARHGVPVKIDDTPNHMHHKFAIVDEQITLTGSYNWTRSAYMYNHENLMVSNDPHLAKQYGQEFEKLWEEFGRFG